MYLVNHASTAEPESSQPLSRGASPGGFAGIVLTLVQRWRTGFKQQPARRHLRVLETLALAPRKQVFLVACDGERFLIGSGADGVQSIVRVSAERSAAPVQHRRGEELC